MASEKILIVDDDEDVLLIVQTILDNAGYSAILARNGREGVEKAISVNPDLILLDVMMPGTNGIAVLEHLRADPELSQTPVIVVSAFASPADRQRAFEAGATRFVKKPFDPEALRSLVEELLPSRV